MLVRPRLLDFDGVDRLVEAALGDDGNRQPFDAPGGLDPIAVMPVTLDVLGAVEDHIGIAPPDQVEEALPGDIAGLDDADAHAVVMSGGGRLSRVWIQSIHHAMAAAGRIAGRDKLSVFSSWLLNLLGLHANQRAKKI